MISTENQAQLNSIRKQTKSLKRPRNSQQSTAVKLKIPSLFQNSYQWSDSSNKTSKIKTNTSSETTIENYPKYNEEFAINNFLNELRYNDRSKSQILELCEKISDSIKMDNLLSGINNLKKSSILPTDDYSKFEHDLILYQSQPFPMDIIDANQMIEQNSQCIKGLIPEYNCAYIVLQNRLYVWKFLENSNSEHIIEKRYYSNVYKMIQEDEIICSVGFGRIRNESFNSYGIYNILIVGLITQLKIYQLENFSDHVGIKNIDIAVKLPSQVQIINFSEQGRIFIGCWNGKVYELLESQSSVLNISLKGIFEPKLFLSSSLTPLQAQISETLYKIISTPIQLFSAKAFNIVNQIAIDESRNILYALVINNVWKNQSFIIVFDLGTANKNKFEEIIKIFPKMILSQLKFKFKIIFNRYNTQYEQRTLPPNPFSQSKSQALSELKFEKISAINKYSSEKCNLLILTQSGMRIYISITQKTKSQQFDLNFTFRQNKSSNSFDIQFTKMPIGLEMKWHSSNFQPILQETYEKFCSRQLDNEKKIIYAQQTKNNLFIAEQHLPHQAANNNNNISLSQQNYIYVLNPSLFQLGKLKDFNEQIDTEPEETISYIHLAEDKSQDILLDNLDIKEVPDTLLISHDIGVLLRKFSEQDCHNFTDLNEFARLDFFLILYCIILQISVFASKIL